MYFIPVFTTALVVIPAVSAQGLNTLAKAAGKLYFGTATDNDGECDGLVLRKII